MAVSTIRLLESLISRGFNHAIAGLWMDLFTIRIDQPYEDETVEASEQIGGECIAECREIARRLRFYKIGGDRVLTAELSLEEIVENGLSWCRAQSAEDTEKNIELLRDALDDPDGELLDSETLADHGFGSQPEEE